MIDVFNKRIEKAPDDNKRMIACRNKMLFLIGINVGLRASDLVSLKWNFFLNTNFASKREQCQTCLSIAEREQSQDRDSGIN